MPAVSNAPGTSSTGVPVVPHVRYRVVKPPPVTNRSPAGRGGVPSVARLYPTLASVSATIKAAATASTRRAHRGIRRQPGTRACQVVQDE